MFQAVQPDSLESILRMYRMPPKRLCPHGQPLKFFKKKGRAIPMKCDCVKKGKVDPNQLKLPLRN
jgi:hypothetical protein